MARRGGFYGGSSGPVSNPLPITSETRPWYLDVFWAHFRGRGFNASQGASNASLSAKVDAGANALPVVDGTLFQVGECVLVGSLQTFQSVVITAIAGNTLTVCPPLWPNGFASNTPVTHAWGNDSHPNYTNAYVGFAQTLVDATRGTAMNGPNLLGTAGDCETFAGGVPAGWTVLGSPPLAPTRYATGDTLPQARSGSGVQLTAAAPFDGLLSAGVGVSPGNWIHASALIRHVSGPAGFRLMLVSTRDPAQVLAQSEPAGSLLTRANGCMGPRTVLRALVPPGCDGVQVRLAATASGDVAQVDDVRLLHSRTDPGTDPPVIPDPGSRTLACIGTSWGVGVTGWPVPLKAALEAKYGHSITVLNACVSGNRLDQMVARFDTDIAPANPVLLIVEYGVNDLSAGRTQAQMEADADAMIAKCRSAGIVPVFTGIPPMASQLATANARNDQVRARIDAAVP